MAACLEHSISVKMLKLARFPLFCFTVFRYNLMLGHKIQAVSKHRPVRVFFYLMNTAMWKSDKLFKLLQADDRFEPVIISYLFPSDTLNGKQVLEQEIRRYCAENGYQYQCGFDFTNNKLLPIDSFEPDLVFYPQPYHEKLSELPSEALMAYIPYCFEVERGRVFHNWLYQNICWKMFLPNEFHYSLERKYNVNKGRNVVVAGYPLSDFFFDGHIPGDKCWKEDDPSKKKIIWAPHHSILAEDTLDYSLFLDIAEGMLEVVKEYQDRVQFVFKPHPVLRDKLNRHPNWGVGKTDSYYKSWCELPNCNFVSGGYVDLFMTSDAMIHDCSSFTVEYLYVNKPVMFLSKTGKAPAVFNEFGQECYDVHYHGTTINDIRRFIEDIIDGKDPLCGERTAFVSQELRLKSDSSVGQKIYEEICQLVN